MSRVLFSESAKADLLEAWLFIAETNIDAADGVVDAVHQEAQTLEGVTVLRVLHHARDIPNVSIN